ncbi:MAG: mycothiol synthase [Candidatus Accumulibacter sp.]|uniref:mycothiol synthase n=1 Tax=Accumulibacter sp. TaxID=2053492 RepID=UPI001B15EA07|nr:mycothiol synthase [Accumulibacter sp.]MBO3704168.1 mycothiol synthase [Accumulibacter sp.]
MNAVKTAFPTIPAIPASADPLRGTPEILYRDAALLVVDKPAGLLTVPGRGEDKQDCLSARLQAEFADALIVHRLDMHTSGVVVLARGKEMQRRLSSQFANRQVEKRYVAVVAGELLVAPVARPQGTGTRLLAALAEQGTPAVWAHGDLPRTRAFARANGWRRVRLLHKMSRPLLPDDDAEIALPQGFSLRSFTPGDADAWLAVNGRASADHPEQGRVTRADLDRLLAQPWFDPAGLLLLVDDATGDLAGSHWTKVDPQERAPGTDGRATAAGEVYVVAVDPAYHGRGLAVPLTAAGLAHLARRGLRAVVLYVDGDNDRALRTYRRLGFTDLEVHAQYRRVPAAAKMEP